MFIPSMDLLGRVNAVYSKFFGSSPPARACVGVDLPENIRVKLDCIATREENPSDRQSLHVQGLSYWAPANIGPYSQAIKVRKLLPSSSVSKFQCKLSLVNVYLYQVKLDSSPVNLFSHFRALFPQSLHWLHSMLEESLVHCKKARAEAGMVIHS
jgi:hypothetical protein